MNYPTCPHCGAKEVINGEVKDVSVNIFFRIHNENITIVDEVEIVGSDYQVEFECHECKQSFVDENFDVGGFIEIDNILVNGKDHPRQRVMKFDLYDISE
jgi:hypothetical protein